MKFLEIKSKKALIPVSRKNPGDISKIPKKIPIVEKLRKTRFSLVKD